jgi:hypothetical protein
MPLDLLHNVLLLDLAFESAERTFQSFAILDVDFSHYNSPPFSPSYYSVTRLSTDNFLACALANWR